MKLNRFLLAKDPRNERGGLAIIHTIDPQAIIAIVKGNVLHYQPFRQFTYNGNEGPAEYTLVIHHIYTTNLSSLINDDGQIVYNLLKRSWNWYKSYLEFEDKFLKYGKKNN